jgi:hypothetical protein
MDSSDAVNPFLFDFNNNDRDNIKDLVGKALDFLYNDIKIPSKIFENVNGYWAMTLVGKMFAYRIIYIDQYFDMFITKKFHFLKFKKY